MTHKERYYYKKSLGLCTYHNCTNSAVSGKTRCQYHLDKEALSRFIRKQTAADKVVSKQKAAGKIAEINAKARELHMSYGEYMALAREGKHLG